MNLVVDESVDRQIVERLRQDGHEAMYIAEMAPSVPDEAVLDRANAIKAVLVTADKDFGEIVYRGGRIHAGVILIRLGGVPSEAKAIIVTAAIRDHFSELADAFSVVTRSTVRIRRRL